MELTHLASLEDGIWTMRRRQSGSRLVLKGSDAPRTDRTTTLMLFPDIAWKERVVSGDEGGEIKGDSARKREGVGNPRRRRERDAF